MGRISPAPLQPRHHAPCKNADDGSTFQAMVSNSSQTVPSGLATLTINTPPSITMQPANRTVNLGQTAIFSVSATGASLFR